MNVQKQLANAQRIGIWGMGATGTAAIRFFSWLNMQGRCAATLVVWDDKPLTSDALALVRAHHGQLGTDCFSGVQEFLTHCDLIVVSPGVDIRSHTAFFHKFCSEPDLFAYAWHRPIIAITGTVGKTSTTALIAHTIAQLSAKKIALGGNIGTGMLSLPLDAADADIAVLELSSFQLEYTHIFRPKIAIWTNLSANHLDRHETLDAYVAAKLRMFQNQGPGDVALIGISALQHPLVGAWAQRTQSRVIVVGMSQEFAHWAHLELLARCEWVTPGAHDILLHSPGMRTHPRVICSRAQIPDCSLIENWLFVTATLLLSDVDMRHLAEITQWPEAMLAHRTQHIGRFGNVDFYNDSKSTVIASTHAALRKMSLLRRPIILILGGMLKGAPLPQGDDIRARFPLVRAIYAFGPAWHAASGMQWYPTLELLVDALMRDVRDGDVVLFSPSGASYDFFKDYMHRGTVFRELVMSRSCSSSAAKAMVDCSTGSRLR